MGNKDRTICERCITGEDKCLKIKKMREEGILKENVKLGAFDCEGFKDKITDDKFVSGTETLKCPACKRVGCWMESEDPEYIICKCGQEVMR